jgi:H+/gluconate symporter-like permease
VISRVVAASFALCAFAVAIVAGMAAGQGTGAILTRALVAMIICYPVGYLAGMICQWVVDQHIDADQKQAEGGVDSEESTEDVATDASHADEVITV